MFNLTNLPMKTYQTLYIQVPSISVCRVTAYIYTRHWLYICTTPIYNKTLVIYVFEGLKDTGYTFIYIWGFEEELYKSIYCFSSQVWLLGMLFLLPPHPGLFVPSTLHSPHPGLFVPSTLHLPSNNSSQPHQLLSVRTGEISPASTAMAAMKIVTVENGFSFELF